MTADLLQRIAPYFERFSLDTLDSGDDPPTGFDFELSEQQLAGLVQAFAADERLWKLFRCYRSFASRCLPYEVLLDVANLYGTTVYGEKELAYLIPRELTPEQRRERSANLLWFKRAAVRLRERTPFAPVARRVNRALGLPLVDGLQLWALAQATIDDGELWRDFRRAVR